MIFTELIVDIAASAILLFFGFLFGKFRERKMQGGKNLDDYESCRETLLMFSNFSLCI